MALPEWAQAVENDVFNRAAYGRIANRYAVYRPRYPKELFDAILGYVRERSLAMDCATGTGQAAIALTPHFDRVLAYDVSFDQVSHIEKLPNLSGFAARSEAVPVRGGLVDLITVAQAVHWFDIDRFWEEARRIAKQEAIVAIWGYGFFEVDSEVDPIVMETLRNPVAKYWGSGNLILIDEYRTIPFPFEELPAPRIVMRESWTLERLLDYVGTWSALVRHDHEHGTGLIEEARAKLSKVWLPDQVREVRMPVTMRIGRVAR